MCRVSAWKRERIEKYSVLELGTVYDVAKERNSKRSDLLGILWESGSSKSRRDLLKDAVKWRYCNSAMTKQWLRLFTAYGNNILFSGEASYWDTIGDNYNTPSISWYFEMEKCKKWGVECETKILSSVYSVYTPEGSISVLQCRVPFSGTFCSSLYLALYDNSTVEKSSEVLIYFLIRCMEHFWSSE